MESSQVREPSRAMETGAVSIDISEPSKKKEEKKKKKKKKSKSKSKRGKSKPTGFEEYHVDTPIAPTEYAEELDLYHSSRPIIHRMEDAILRYQAKRRITPERREVFLKYLAYGGVTVAQKMFAGVDDRQMQDMDSEQIMTIRGQISIENDRRLPVDFDAVVRGYLTSYFPYYFNPETEGEVQLATVTIRNFLSYILYHNVFPEYTDNIDKARISCDIAAKDLWNNQQFTAQGPGDFNKGCSMLFGGVFFGSYVEDSQWVNTKDESTVMTCTAARKTVKFALAAAGSNSQSIRFRDLANQDVLRALRVEDIDGFEITAVVPPKREVRQFYETHAPDLQPVGKVFGIAYRDPGKPGLDLRPEERSRWEHELPTEEFEFFLEESLMKLCYPGMKVITSVFTLNCGMYFFDDVFTAYSSIYMVLPNDLMIGWKEPRDYFRDNGGNEGGPDNENEEKRKGI